MATKRKSGSSPPDQADARQKGHRSLEDINRGTEPLPNPVKSNDSYMFMCKFCSTHCASIKDRIREGDITVFRKVINIMADVMNDHYRGNSATIKGAALCCSKCKTDLGWRLVDHDNTRKYELLNSNLLPHPALEDICKGTEPIPQPIKANKSYMCRSCRTICASSEDSIRERGGRIVFKKVVNIMADVTNDHLVEENFSGLCCLRCKKYMGWRHVDHRLGSSNAYESSYCLPLKELLYLDKTELRDAYTKRRLDNDTLIPIDSPPDADLVPGAFHCTNCGEFVSSLKFYKGGGWFANETPLNINEDGKVRCWKCQSVLGSDPTHGDEAYDNPPRLLDFDAIFFWDGFKVLSHDVEPPNS